MSLADRVGRTGRGLAVAAAILGAVGLMTSPPAEARVSTGAAVGIGLGAFALGTAVGAAPYYAYPAPYGYYYPPTYYYPPAPAPAYYAPYPRNCWDPYYGRYYAC